MITAKQIVSVIRDNHFRYETERGQQIIAAPVSQLPQLLREAGYRNVPRLDEYDLTRLGCVIETARYISGARPKRFCRVVEAVNA
jgi:hypothetical protein